MHSRAVKQDEGFKQTALNVKSIIIFPELQDRQGYPSHHLCTSGHFFQILGDSPNTLLASALKGSVLSAL